MNDETRDQALSRLYREGAWPEPSRQIDKAIIAASRRASRERHPLLWRFAPSFAIAATVVLSSAIVLKVYREQPGVVATVMQDKPAAVLRAKSSPEAKQAEQKPADTRPVAPSAPEPQAEATPQGFAPTMDAFEAARIERAQRDLGLKDAPSAGIQQVAKTAPAARAAPQPLKKETSQPPAANAERRADAPQVPASPTFNAIAASAPPAAPQAPAQAARAATSKPSQLSTQAAPQTAPSAEATQAAPSTGATQTAPRAEATQTAPRADATQAAPGAEAAQAPPAEPLASGSASIAALMAPPGAKAERTPQAWLDDIRKLVKEGKLQEADAEIARFKKRYPDYVLPEDMR